MIKMQKGNNEKHIKNTLGVFSNAKAYEKEMENRKWLSKSGSWLGFVVLILLHTAAAVARIRRSHFLLKTFSWLPFCYCTPFVFSISPTLRELI